MPVHNALSGSEVHQDKLISTAVTGDAGKVTTPSAVTAGTGVLRNLLETEISQVTDVISVLFSDVTTAGSLYFAAPYNGVITKLQSVINGALASADEKIRLRLGGVAVTDSEITIANSGSAAGDVDTASPSSGNSVTAGQAVQVQTDGASSGGASCVVTVFIRRS
jgi:hypothetical protein